MTIPPLLHRITAAQPYPRLFATISGAHWYGFPSPDSDFDLRGAHVLPLPKVLGLEERDETVEDSRVIEGLEIARSSACPSSAISSHASSPDRSKARSMTAIWPFTKVNMSVFVPNSKPPTMPARCARCRRRPHGRR